jgi:hypothetical protein
MPGIPFLYGAYIDANGHLAIVVQNTGDSLGRGLGLANEPTRLKKPYLEAAKHEPVALARSLLRCFESFSTGGFFMDDFASRQFTMSPHTKQIFVVDGPDFLPGPFADYVKLSSNGTVPQIRHANRGACTQDSDCPATSCHHSCSCLNRACEHGSVGAPESRGVCIKGTCGTIDSKTHVFDVAGRAWLLPVIIKLAEINRCSSAVNQLLAMSISMQNPRKEKRPSFSDLLVSLKGVTCPFLGRGG